MRFERTVLLGLVLLLIGVPVGCSDPVFDTSDQLARYRAFPLVPGAVQRSDETYEIRNDGNPSGDFARKLVYEVPADRTAAEVLGFLRSHLPEGWTEATEDTCRRAVATFPTAPSIPGGPPATVPSGLVLLSTESQLTVFAPGEDGVRDPGDGRLEGFTFSLSRSGDQKLLTLDLPSLSCGVPQPDRQADEFDHGPRPSPVAPTVPVSIGAPTIPARSSGQLSIDGGRIGS